MQTENLSNNPKLTVGVKQTTKILDKGEAAIVYVAKDAEQHVIRHVLELCEAKNVDVVYIESMKDLGVACGIDVGAATAVIER